MNEILLKYRDEKSAESKMESSENGACKCRLAITVDNDIITLDYMG